MSTDADSSGSAVVLFSGGQDSTTCLFWAKGRFAAVSALAFDYGQRHAVELRQARIVADLAGVPFETMDIRGLLGNSALLAIEGGNVNAPHAADATLPASFVPGRNLLFLTLAAIAAYNQGIADLVTGMCQTDFSGYPDCRRAFADSLETTLALALAPRPFRIHTPLMDLDKADTFRMAEELGVLDIVLEHSHTDYHGDRSERHPWGYGKLDNPASRLRAEGWAEFRRRHHGGE